MAVTILNQITPLHGHNAAAYTANNAIIQQCTSNRDSDDAFTVTGVTNSGGFVSYTVASHTLLVDDVITGSAFGSSTYNVDQTVTAITGTTVVTNVAYVANSSGTITRNNNNFKLKGTLYIYDGAELTFSISNSGGFAFVTTTTAHGFTGSEYVLILNSSTHNGIYKIPTSVPTTTTFFILDSDTLTLVPYTAVDSGQVMGSTVAGSKYVTATDGTFTFNWANMIQSYVSHEFLTFGASNITSNAPNAACARFSCNYQEYFDNISGLSTAYAYNHGIKYVAHNFAAQINESPKLDTDYSMLGSSDKFFSDAPLRRKIRVGEESQLSFCVAVEASYKVAYEQFNTSGASIGTSYTAAVTIRDRGIISVNSTFFSSSHSRVDVWLVDSGNVQMSEKRRFDVDTSPILNSVRIYWLNRKGGFDDYTFKGNYSSSIALEKQIIQAQLGTTFNTYDQSSKTINVDANNYVEVYSDFENAATMAWLKTLLTSPLVYYYDGTDRYCINSSIREMKDYDKSAPQQLKFIFSLPKLTIQNQ